MQEVVEGHVLAGKYRVERVLGRGGMGVVVAARHLVLDETVAIKFLLPEALASEEAVARFEREARAAVRIKSEHVVRVTDVGRLESGAPYMVMEYLEGEDLSTWLHERGPLPVDQAADFVLQACVALADAHSVGIIHRDLKPGNLFCVRRSDGQLVVKVLDFGISKIIEAARGSESPPMSVTKTAAIMGSPLYMSPEQVQSSKDVDARSDIWALGVVLFQLLTGDVPFMGQAFGDVAIKIATQPTPSVCALRPDLPAQLDFIIGRCLEKQREQRFANVAELAIALSNFAPRRSRATVERITSIVQASGVWIGEPSVPSSQPAALPEVRAAGTDAPWSGSAPPNAARARSGKAWWWMSGGLAMLALVGVGVAVRRSSSHPGLVGGAAGADVATAIVSEPARAPSSLPVDVGVALAAEPKVEPVPTPSPSLAPSALPAPKPKAVAPAAPVAAKPPSFPPKRNCDPSYTLDEQGRKKFKPECFLDKPTR